MKMRYVFRVMYTTIRLILFAYKLWHEYIPIRGVRAKNPERPLIIVIYNKLVMTIKSEKIVSKLHVNSLCISQDSRFFFYFFTRTEHYRASGHELLLPLSLSTEKHEYDVR